MERDPTITPLKESIRVFFFRPLERDSCLFPKAGRFEGCGNFLFIGHFSSRFSQTCDFHVPFKTEDIISMNQTPSHLPPDQTNVNSPRVCCPVISQEVMAQPKREAEKQTGRFFTHGDQGLVDIHLPIFGCFRK